MTEALPDPRTHAYRPDLADSALAHQVKADRFVEPFFRQSVCGVLPLLKNPSFSSPQVSQIRYGEFLDVLELRDDGFAWVQNRSDRYVGYIPLVDGGLLEEISDLSHRVSVLRTFLYEGADIKSPVIDELTLGAYVRPLRTVDCSGLSMLELAGGGYIVADHVMHTDATRIADYAFTAGRLLGVPYLWGGRTPKGIDCSGLVQLALDMAGHECPRDSDQQREALGKPLHEHWRDMPWRRGDIVFLDPGHVGIMVDHTHLLHASGIHMLVTVQPLVDVVAERDAKIKAYAQL